MTLEELMMLEEDQIEIEAEVDFDERMTEWETNHWTESLQPKTLPMPPCPVRLSGKEWYQQQLKRLGSQ